MDKLFHCKQIDIQMEGQVDRQTMSVHTILPRVNKHTEAAILH